MIELLAPVPVASMSSEGLYGCRFDKTMRWGQKIVDTFDLHGVTANQLFYADDVRVAQIVEEMISAYQLS